MKQRLHVSRRVGFILCMVASLLLSGIVGVQRTFAAASTTITVSGTPLGVSTRYIGTNITINDLSRIPDIGFNTVRIWNDITQFEPTDDDGTYGTPTIDELKEDTNIDSSGRIPWSVWDTNFESYRGVLDTAKAQNLRFMFSLRHTGYNHGKGWLENQPPQTDADWNEWWEHVFAQAYWLNVRNDYHVDDWEMFNEPDHCCQGWDGDTLQYEKFVEVTTDALNYLYSNYLPGRTPRTSVSSTSYPQVGGKNVPNGWQDDVLHWVGDRVTDASYHVYATGDKYVEGSSIAHGQLVRAQRHHYPLWTTEWGSYSNEDQASAQNCNSNVGCTVKVVDAMLLGSLPGANYIYGSHYYYWGTGNYGDSIFDAAGNPRSVYYALRLGMRALQGGKTTFESTTSTTDLRALTTKDADGNLYLLVTNRSANNHTSDIDLSALFPGSSATTVYRYDANNLDTSAEGPVVNDGKVTLDAPANSLTLLKIANTGSNSADTQAPTVPGDLKATGKNESQVSLDWNAASDTVSVDGYDIYANGAVIAGVPGDRTDAILRNLKPDTDYTFIVKARDPAGNLSESNAVTLKTDPQPAGKYEAENALFKNSAARNFSGYDNYSGLGYADNFVNAGALATLTVDVPADGDYVVNAHYTNGTNHPQAVSVYVGGNKIAQSILSPTLSDGIWGDQATTVHLNAGQNSITYQIDAGDGASFKLDYIEVSPAGGTRPAKPSIATITSGNEQATLSWNAVDGASGYKVLYGNGDGLYNSSIAVGNATNVTIPGLTAGFPYHFQVVALNRNGESEPSRDKRVEPKDGSVPAKLIGTPFGSPQAETAFSTYHNAVDGNVGNYFAGPGNGAYAGIDLGVGNESVITQIRFHPRGNDPWFQYLMLNGKFQGSNSLYGGWTDLYTIEQQPGSGWTTVSVSNRYAYRYLRYLGRDGSGGNVGEIEFYRASYGKPTKALEPRVTCVLKISDTDYLARFGYLSRNTAPVSLPVGTLNRFAGEQIDRGQPDIFRSGQQDAVFDLHFDGQPLKWSLNGKTATASVSSPACSPDTTPPTAPRGLTSSNVTPTGITLGWGSSSDNIEVSGYRVYVNNDEVGTTTETSFALTGLTPGASYTLSVKAYDLVGNLSVASTVNIKLPVALVSASHTSGSDTPNKAIDGDINTRYASGSQQVGMWFQLDFMAERTINQIVLDNSKWINDYPRGYEVYVSNDGTNWGSPVVSGTGSSAGKTTITFVQPQTARYVRIVLTQATGWYWAINELSVA